MPHPNKIEITPEIQAVLDKNKGETLKKIQAELLSELGLSVSKMWISRRFPFHVARKRMRRVKLDRGFRFVFTKAMDDFIISVARMGTIPKIAEKFEMRFGIDVGPYRIAKRLSELNIDLFNVDGYTRMTEVLVLTGLTSQAIMRRYSDKTIKMGHFIYLKKEDADKIIEEYKMPDRKTIGTVELASIMGVSHQWVYHLIKIGKIEAIKVGRFLRVYEDNEVVRNARYRARRK